MGKGRVTEGVWCGETAVCAPDPRHVVPERPHLPYRLGPYSGGVSPYVDSGLYCHSCTCEKLYVDYFVLL